MKKGKLIKNKKAILGIFLATCLVALGGAMSFGKNPSREEIQYKEKTVVKGVMQSGVTERGSVDIGTIEQSFELDMSALQRVSSSGSSSSSKSQSGGGVGGFGGSSGQMGGAMNMFGQTMNLSGGNTFTQSDDSSSLTVEEVCVSVGQEVKAGDVLYILEEGSVQELKETLESDVDKAKADLDKLYADQKASRQSAQSTYDESISYGSYMQTEYNQTVSELEETVTQAKETLKQAKESLAEYQALYDETKVAYDEASQILTRAEWSRDNTDKESHVGDYVNAFQSAQQAQSTVSQLEQKLNQLSSRIESAESTVQRAQKSLNQAQRRLEQGKLEANETLQLRKLAYETAQETYDITIAYLEANAKEQEETYASAKEKWDSFASYIDGYNICSLYDGTVTSVELKAGDTVGTNTLLVKVNNQENVTMTVSVTEKDMDGIAVGTKANIVLSAFPEEVFEAVVTEVSEAQSGNNGSVYYEVTATLRGELDKLYQSMTGEITFVTGETQEEVLYVSKRAVTTDGEKSKVKVRQSDGSVVEKVVVTGFTDGVNIEIKEGLSEGEIVLIESRVKEK